MKPVFFILLACVSSGLFAQSINMDYYNKTLFISTFMDKDIQYWPAVNNYKSKILIENGKYHIESKDNIQGEKVFPGYENNFSNYELFVSLILISGDYSEQSAGVCFQFDEKHQKGYVVEINAFKRFRLLRWNNEEKKIISNQGDQDGWIKFNMLEKKNKINEIKILSRNNLFDIYFNEFFAYSFENEFKQERTSNFGFYVAPMTEIRIQNMSLMVNRNEYNEASSISNTKTNNETEDTDPEKVEDAGDKDRLLKLLLRFRDEIKEKQNENEQLKEKLEKCQQDKASLEKVATHIVESQSNMNIKQIEEENVQLKKEVQKLQRELSLLKKYEEFYEKENTEKDLLNFINKERQSLENENKILKERIKNLEMELQLNKSSK
jgi:hypothetical protein